jgi:hypothetical protein
MTLTADLDECIEEYLNGGGGMDRRDRALRVKVAGAEEHSPSSLRATTIFRREDGEWKFAHRHADPITGARSPESLIQA